MAKLNTRNLQAGIDLGTTNSVIAFMEPQGVILPEIKAGEILLPSCVYFDDNQNYFVGQDAIKKMHLGNKMNGHIEFKRKMGTNYSYSFHNLNRNLRPEELSGLILNKLRSVYNDHVGEELFSAVVTVPAKFDLKSCQSTRIAAMGNYPFQSSIEEELLEQFSKSEYYAPLLHAEILMEPIAASLAYGLNNESAKNGNWLVYDLGGGTFDAAIVNSYNGDLQVKHNEGDNYLGGKNMDEALVKYIINDVLIKELKYDLSGFFSNAKYASSRAFLKWIVEEAKKKLSSEPEVIINIPNPEFSDNRGNKVKATILITRAKYISLVGPIYLKTIDIIEKMLLTNNLKNKDIDKIILVGGPTKFPWLIEQLETQLKIEVENTIDPMTAIAKGAAIKATLSSPPVVKKDEIININTKQPVDCILEIITDNTSEDVNYTVAGKIKTTVDNLNNIEAIFFDRSDARWQSGNVKINTEGTFDAKLFLKEKEYNSFYIKILGKNGVAFSVTPNEFQVFHTDIKTGDIAPYNLNVTLNDGFCSPIIKKDTPLDPAEETKLFHNPVEIRQGNKEDKLIIELTEGGSIYPENNFRIGELIVSGDKLVKNLPSHSELYITIIEEKDRNVIASCYIPYLRQTFDAKIKIKVSETIEQEIQEKAKKLGDKYEEILKDKKFLSDNNLLWFEKQNFDEKNRNFNRLIGDTASEDIDNLLQANQGINETQRELEEFEKTIIFIKLKTQIKAIKNDKIYIEFKEEIDDIEERLLEAEKELDLILAKNIEKELLWYNIDHIAFYFVDCLFFFTMTKLLDFQSPLVELHNSIIKEYDSYLYTSFLPNSSKTIHNINKDYDKARCTSIEKNLNRFDYNIREILQKQENENNNYPISDYEKIAKIFNSLNNTNSWGFHKKVVWEVVKKVSDTYPSDRLITVGKKCAEMLMQKNISDAKSEYNNFTNLFITHEVFFGSDGPSSQRPVKSY